MVAGLLLQIFALVSLNRSFALVAAQRTIKTNRMYGIVRHPMYASYGLTFGAYLLANASWSNFIVYLSLVTLLGARIVREERLLANDATYREYMQQVRYRLVPLVY